MFQAIVILVNWNCNICGYFGISPMSKSVCLNYNGLNLLSYTIPPFALNIRMNESEVRSQKARIGIHNTNMANVEQPNKKKKGHKGIVQCRKAHIKDSRHRNVHIYKYKWKLKLVLHFIFSTIVFV